MDSNQGSAQSSMAASTRLSPGVSLRNVLIKSVLLFLLLNLLFALLKPVPWFAQISAYNSLFPGRQRLPFGEIQEKAYNLSLYQLDAMFLSHKIAAGKSHNEYRVIVIGDSSVWGYLLKPDQTLTAYLNRMQLTTPGGKPVKFYNLGYPTINLTKDILILQVAMKYKPDLVVWLTTLEAFPRLKQLTSPIVQHNPNAVRALIEAYNLNLDPKDPNLVDPSFWEQTIIGQRRSLADLFRLQLYGVLWAATGVDQYYPETYDPPQANLEASESFYDLTPPALDVQKLALDSLSAGGQLAGGVPILLVNEPIYISHGDNSNIRYNFFYPRWAYDQYRSLLGQFSQTKGWAYLDLWDLIPSGEFTNSAIHLSPVGTEKLASQVIPAVKTIVDKTYVP